MKLVQWKRFSWPLANLPEAGSAMETQYHVRLATREELDTVQHVVLSAFSLDSAWADTLKHIRAWIVEQIGEAFAQKEARCLVITHGTRIIGASALDMNAEAENHLLTGPCILSEYRSRGLGSGLLFQSLRTLREAGVTRAHGIVKANVPVAKFIYPKFNSSSEPVQFEPVLLSP